MALADAVPFAVAAWTLDEASGTRADSVGSNDLADNNTVGSATGKFGNAADFEASASEYLSIADNTDLSMGDVDFTLRAWAQLESDSHGCVLGKIQSGNRAYQIQYIAGVGFRFAITADGTNYVIATASNFGLASTGVWYLIHCWHDSTANEIGISINAGTANTVSHSGGIFDGTAEFRIGSQFEDSLHWDGLIDDVVIIKGYILDATERTEDYNSGTGIAFADWAGGGSFTINADPGSYALTGTVASLEQGYEVQADTGSFSISGVAASLEQGYEIPTDAGEYLVTGTEPNLEQSLLLTVDVGLYSITGANANLEQGIMINPEEGSYVINGVDATLVYGDVLGVEPGEYLVTGTEPSLEQGFLTSIEIGSYLLTGVDAGLDTGLKISVDPGPYSLTGTDVNFIEGFGFSADVGNYLVTGVSASLLQHSILNAAVGSYVITGVAANLAENLENIVGGRFIIGQVYYPGFVNAEIFYPGFQQAQVNN